MKKLQTFVILFIGIIILLGGCCLNDEITRPEEAENTVDDTISQQTESVNNKTILSIGMYGEWSSSFRGKIIHKNIDDLKKQSNGNLEIKLYDKGRLGSGTQIFEGVQEGTINMMCTTPSIEANVVPEAALLGVPGLFHSIEEFNKLMSSSYKTILQGYYRKAGLELLAIFAYSYREITSSVPVTSLEDINGLKIWVLPDRYQTSFWSNLGASVVPLSSSQVYMGLQKGLISAEENSIDGVLSEHIMEVQNYMIFTNHMLMTSALVMNKKQYDSLSAQNKAYLLQFADNFSTEMITQMPQNDKIIIDMLINDYQMKMIYPNDELLTEIYSNNEEIINAIRRELGDEKVNIFMKALEDISESNH